MRAAGALALGGFALFLNAASFGSLSVILWTTGGPMGESAPPSCWRSGAIYAVVNSPRSASC